MKLERGHSTVPNQPMMLNQQLNCDNCVTFGAMNSSIKLITQVTTKLGNWCLIYLQRPTKVDRLAKSLYVKILLNIIITFHHEEMFIPRPQ